MMPSRSASRMQRSGAPSWPGGARCRGLRSWMGCIRSGMTSQRPGSGRVSTRRSERTLASSTPMEPLLPAKARRGTVVTTKPVRFLSLAIGLHQIDARRNQSCSRRERAISRAHPYYGNALPSYRRVAYAALLGNFFGPAKKWECLLKTAARERGSPWSLRSAMG